MVRPKILILCGSLKSGSSNARLADAFVGELAMHECEVTRITLADYELPIYDGDLEAKKGVPKNAEKLAKLFANHQGIVFASPSYNGSITPLLKNTIDWVSRVHEVGGKKIAPYNGTVAAIASASPGGMGGVESLNHMRDILVRLKMLVISEQLAVGNAQTAFDENDKLNNERQANMLTACVQSLVEKSTVLI
ncbi:MAG: NADPH-dependent FMN reductase [Nitratireductor sp.]